MYFLFIELCCYIQVLWPGITGYECRGLYGAIVKNGVGYWLAVGVGYWVAGSKTQTATQAIKGQINPKQYHKHAKPLPVNRWSIINAQCLGAGH